MVQDNPIMWTGENNNIQKGFYTPPPKFRSRLPFTSNTCISENKVKNPNSFHVLHKVPSGNSPYVKAKHAQLIEKNPNRAVALFWNAINSGDRVESALKDMAVVMKQLDRSNEAIEAIKSFRHLCSSYSQESLDNVLVELYKRSGRLEEQIEVLEIKLKRLEESHASLGKKEKVARSHGKKHLITAEQEYARLLGNLGWAHLQQNDYKKAEEYYRKALSIETDRNKQCNLAICLICMNRIIEAKFLLQTIRDSAPKGQMNESYAKSFERASKLMAEIESESDKLSRVEYDENSPFTLYESNQLETLKDGKDSYGNFSQKSTYTPPVRAQRILKSPFTQPHRSSIPDSPFTQPRRCSVLFDSGNWKKKKERIPENPFTQPIRILTRRLDDGNNVSKSYFPRRLQFGDFSSDFVATTRDLNTICQETEGNKSVESTPITDVDRKENSPPSRSDTGFNPKDSNKTGQKSWADMVEEDEKEIAYPFSGAYGR